VALQGTIDSFALADVMRLLGSSSKTGRLIVNGDRGTADLWFASGALVGGGSSSQEEVDDVAEVVFDILRYRSGSFVFEADATPGATHPAHGEPADVDAVIGQAEDALAEWSEIVAVVPSLDSWLTLAPELLHPEVVVDQACWTAIVTVGGGTTVRDMGAQLGLGELPSSRLVRALVQAGFVEVGAPRDTDADLAAADGLLASLSDPAPAADPSPAIELPMRHPHPVPEPVASFGEDLDADARTGVDPYRDPSIQPSADSSPGSSFDSFDPGHVVEAAPQPSSFDLVESSFDTPLDRGPGADGLSAGGNATGDLDPFSADDGSVALPSLTISGLTDDPFADESFGDEPAADLPAAPAWAGVLVEPEVPTDPPDVARSMSMLSDRAAQALASVVAKETGPTVVADDGVETADLDDERARMLRFLGSV
jgi:hypothetical protein